MSVNEKNPFKRCYYINNLLEERKVIYEKNIYLKIIIFLSVSVTLLLTGCSNQLIEYDVENKWMNTIKESDIDYKEFSFAAQNSIYEMRPDYISDFTPDVIKNIKGMLSLSDASEMEKDAIVSAAVEDALIYVHILRAYANAKAIKYAVDEYCQKCYESEAIVKEGKYTFKLSASMHNGKIKYNGKISDLKKYLNKYIQPEARNGYCVIEVNSYNAPIFVCWSKDKINKEIYEEDISYQSFNVEEIQNGIAVVGTYPGNFSIINLITDRIISKTSIYQNVVDFRKVVFTSEDFEDLLDELIFIFECDIDDSISADKFKTDENKKSTTNFDGKTQSINYSEQGCENNTGSSSKQSYNNSKTIMNPFDGIEVQYDGASPYLSATVNTLGCNEYVKKYVTFKIDKDQLRKGEKFIISAEWDESEIYNENINFSQSEKEFVVENVSYYIESLDSIDISELNQLMDDYVEAEAYGAINNTYMFDKFAGNWSDDCGALMHTDVITSIDGIESTKSYIITLKQASTINSDKVYNKLVSFYTVDFSRNCEARNTCNSGQAHIALFMDNIVIEADGTLKYNSTEPLNANLLYFKAESTESILEANYVIAEKAAYNVNQIK